MTAFRHYRNALGFASQKLLSSSSFFSEVVEEHGLALAVAPPNIKADSIVVTIAAQQNWRALEFAGAACLKDRAVVLAAVRKDWQALQFAHQSLQADREIVSVAFEQSWQALRYADKATCHRDRSLVLQAVRANWRAFNFVVGELRDDEEVLMAAVGQNWHVLAPGSCSNLNVMLAAVQQDWRALSCASPELRSNRDLVLAAVSVDEDAWWCVGDDPEFDLERWSQVDEDAHRSCDNSINSNNIESVQEAIKHGWLSNCFDKFTYRHADAYLLNHMLPEHSAEHIPMPCNEQVKHLNTRGQSWYPPHVLGDEAELQSSSCNPYWYKYGYRASSQTLIREAIDQGRLSNGTGSVICSQQQGEITSQSPDPYTLFTLENVGDLQNNMMPYQ